MRSLFVVLILCLSQPVRSEGTKPLKTFLLSSAYGMGVGALVGVASVAISEDPASKMNQIARGASLGLYLGMGFGLYYANQLQNEESFSSWIYPGVSQNGELALFSLWSY